MDEPTGNMIVFFRRLADDIEYNRLSPTDLAKAGQLYMYWKYNEDPLSATSSEEDVTKYLFTGWYIYNSINENQPS
jgi:hypothetical protein